MAPTRTDQRRGSGRAAGPSKVASRKAASKKASSRGTVPKKATKQSARESPRLRLVRDQAPPRYAGNKGQRKDKAREPVPPPRALRKGKGKAGWQGGIPTASPAAVVARGEAKRAKVVMDEGAKAVNGLRNNLKKAAERAIGSAEAECDSIVAASLEGWSVDEGGKEQDVEAAEAVLREVESNQASAAAQCSEMLKSLESNRNALSALVIKTTAALDALGQSESRKLKSSLDRATRAVG